MIRAVAAAAAVLALGVTGEAAAASDPDLRCFGAAARDTADPCDARHQRLRVVPTPIEALLAPNAPCAPGERTGLVSTCHFGWPGPGEPAEEVVLLGDSHAVHWRAAATPAVAARGARGTTIARTGCSFSREAHDLPRKEAAECRRWNRQVIAWFKAHPEVRTVLVANRSGQRVRAGERRITSSERARGRAAALRLLPPSVQRVLVLRDTPVRRTRTLDCIDRAMARRQPAGTACAVPRGNVLHPDPTVGAVKALRSPRYRVVDLTSLMCSRRLCFPVVGGALVNKDGDHLTTAFSASMGPMLLRRLDALVPRVSPAS